MTVLPKVFEKLLLGFQKYKFFGEFLVKIKFNVKKRLKQYESIGKILQRHLW